MVWQQDPTRCRSPAAEQPLGMQDGARYDLRRQVEDVVGVVRVLPEGPQRARARPVCAAPEQAAPACRLVQIQFCSGCGSCRFFSAALPCMTLAHHRGLMWAEACQKDGPQQCCTCFISGDMPSMPAGGSAACASRKRSKEVDRGLFRQCTATIIPPCMACQPLSQPA